MDMDNPEDEKTAAMRFAMKLISLRLRSEKELRARLLDKGYAESLTEETLAAMRHWRYLDDERFAESFIRDSLRFHPAGRYVLEHKLKEKGIAQAFIEEKLAELYPPEEELALARKLAEKKLRLLGGKDPRKSRLKLMAYLQSKGFSSNVISRLGRNAQGSDRDTETDI